MSNKAAISLSTGLEDPERVTVAMLVAVGAAESGHPTLVFMTKEAVRLAIRGVAIGTACTGCPELSDLMKRLVDAGGEFLVCPICFAAKALDADELIDRATIGGTVQLWDWIGAEAASCFSY